MSDNNRFRDVMQAAKNRQEQPQQPEETTRTQPANHTQPGPPSTVGAQPAKRGRPPGGKRNNPDYEQVAAYIPKELYRQVQIRLLQMEPKGQFSDLVEFLLNKWIQQPPRQ